jgi:CheY-like chemotaxis protein
VDGVMPDMDGASVIRRVRLDAATRAMPCLLLTAYEERGSQLRALEAGTDAFVPKDGDMEVVLARLAVVMRRLADPAMAHIASLGGPRKILAVDDSPTFLAELSDALRGEGYEVSTAPSGEEAIELLAVQPVDCILMDLMMPGMGGREACLRIKAAPGVRDIPLILLTARDDRDTMLDGLSAGADDFIVKSSEFEVLAARVLTQIRRKQFEDESRRFRDELMGRELEAADERAARVVAETRAALVDELERKVEARTRELEALATERRQAERMASIGMLSASIAHEINNPLAVVTGNLDLVAIRLKEVLAEPQESAADSMPAELRELLASAEAPLHDALEAAERVREIVRDLKVFSRSDTDDVVGPVDLHEVIESSLRMTSNEIRHRAHFVRDFGEVPPVLGNPSRLGQVLLNLIVNAAQAIPPGQAGAHEVRVSTAMQSADHVLVEIADTGVGIPPDKLGKIFEPFFTTKPAGVGSGLGLAICHRIITELGGTISVDSIVGKGSVFRIVLRRATGCPDAELRPAASLAAPAPTIGRSARILVVDDEPALCSTIERILRREHEVVAVTSAEEATRIIETGERFDVILSDLMMPEMTGMELHALLMQMLPDQAGRMIFMSGGALTQEGAQFLRQQGCAAIDKPFRAAALRDLVRRAIEAVDRAA